MSKKPVKKSKVINLHKKEAVQPEAPKQPPLSDVLMGIRGLLLTGIYAGSQAQNVLEASRILETLSVNQKAGEDKAAAEVKDGEEKDS